MSDNQPDGLRGFADVIKAAGPDHGKERPRAGCQAYPAYVAWLALNGESSATAAGIFANFAAFGRYCKDVAAGMRAHYGFADDYRSVHGERNC